MTATPRHVIFGTGAIGLATFDALLGRGESARLVNRSGHARVPDDVEVGRHAHGTTAATARATSSSSAPLPERPGQRRERRRSQ
jgi:hypothetical protein